MKKLIFTKERTTPWPPLLRGNIVLLLSLAFCCSGLMAQAQCTPDVSYTSAGYYPDSLPIALVDTPYLGVIDVRTPPKDIASPAILDSVVIDSVTGLPSGFSYACSAPGCIFLPDTNECIAITGTADSSQLGIYPLTVYITIHLFFIIPSSFQDSIVDQVVLKVCKNNSCITANFTASDTVICEDSCINFTDLSIDTPTSWQWSFPGANPSSDTVQNPTNICYDTAGIYDIQLIATNANGSDTLIKTGYIQVDTCPPPVDIKIVAPNDKINIYPNPFKTFAYINLPNDIATLTPDLSQGLMFVLYDVLGRKVKSIDKIQSQQLKISRDNLAGGMYIYKIIADDHITLQTGKLFIQ